MNGEPGAMTDGEGSAYRCGTTEQRGAKCAREVGATRCLSGALNESLAGPLRGDKAIP